jgi:hypothetical protein
VGDTGASKVSFAASIGGVDRDPSAPYSFQNDYGWTVTLRRADVFLGPIYLNTLEPLAQTARLWRALSLLGVAHAHEAHLGAGRIVGEVLGQTRFDALSPALTPFPVSGVASAEAVRTAEVWLYPPATVPPETLKTSVAALEVEGTAARAAEQFAFKGRLLLDDTWLPDVKAGDKGGETITSLRQVRGIPTSFTPSEGGRLEIRMNVAKLFQSADFSNLENSPRDLVDGTTRTLVQAKTGKFTTDQVMRNAFNALRATTGTYAVRWRSL